MIRAALALLAFTAWASLWPSTSCTGLTGADCARLAAIDAAIID